MTCTCSLSIKRQFSSYKNWQRCPDNLQAGAELFRVTVQLHRIWNGCQQCHWRVRFHQRLDDGAIEDSSTPLCLPRKGAKPNDKQKNTPPCRREPPNLLHRPEKTETRTEAKGREGVCKGQTQWQTPSAEGQTHHQQSARAGPRPPNRAQTRSHARLEREEWPGVAGRLETSPAKHGAVMAPSVWTIRFVHRSGGVWNGLARFAFSAGVLSPALVLQSRHNTS